MLRLFMISLVFSAVALAQADAGATGVLTRPPALIKQVEAAFPSEMLDAGIGGTVGMEIDIGQDGKVMEVRVTQSAGAPFDTSAVEAVKQFEFSPAEIDGKPSPVRIGYSYTFFFKQQVVEVPVAPVATDAGTGLVNFQGKLIERGTRNPVGGAQIVLGEGEQALEAISDDTGAFSFVDAPIGSVKVSVIAGDYNRFDATEDVVAGQRTEVTYYVRKKVYGGFETVVRGKKERKEVAQVTLRQEEIRLIPGTNGDSFKVIQNLPGVARTPFGLGFLVVRGGKGWDTKTYIDEVQVPQLFHFGGLFATFNSGMLNDISFQAGNFGADFGRSIGGLVQGTVRTPSKKGIHGYADINLIDSSVLIEAPINEDWSIAAAGRRSYIDAVLPAVLGLIPGANDAISFSVAPRYYDYQLRVERKPKNSRTRLFFQLFGSDDKLVALLPNPSIDPEGRGEFGTSLNYNRLLFGLDTKINDRLDFRTRTAIGFDQFSFTLGTDIFAKTSIIPFSSRDTFTIGLPEIRTTLAAGLDLYVLPYQTNIQAPQQPKVNEIPDPFQSRRLVSDKSNVFQIETGLFADAIVQPVQSVKIVAGVRGDYNSQMKKYWVDPRLAAFWQINDMFLLKGGAGIYHQSPDYRQGQLSAKFGNPDLLPEGARQYMIGTEVKFTDAITMDLQLYYKDLFDQTRSTISTGSSTDVNVESVDLRYTSIGKGRGFGAELLLRHQLTKNFFGWISYSLSRTERDYRGGTEWGLSPFDQPHNLVVVASYKLPYDFIVGGKIRYTSGPLTTPFIGSIYDANGSYYFPIQGKPFSQRLPDFFQLDVRIDKRFVFQDWMFALYLDVQNATNRGNVESVINNYDYTKQVYLTGLPILPVLGMRGEW